MSKFAIIKNALRSTRLRQLLLGDSTGIREVAVRSLEEVLSEQEEERRANEPGLIKKTTTWLWNAGKAALFSIKNGNFTISGAIRWLIGAAKAIYNFNWNISDKEIDARLQSLQRSLIGRFGEFVGTSLGWLICGIAPSASLMVVNKALSYHLLKEVGEEALEEIGAELISLGKAVARSALEALFWVGYKNVRKLIKYSVGTGVGALAKAAKFILGTDYQKAVKSWGSEGSAPFSFRKLVDDAVESIKNPFLQEFIEEALDGFGDACEEGLIVLGGAADSWIYEQQLQRELWLGQEETVEIILNRATENEPFRESIILHGTQNTIVGQMTQLMATNQLLEYYSMGVTINGEPASTYARKMQSQFEIIISWSSSKYGFNRDGETWTQCSISNIERAKLNNWQQIKTLAGGHNGRMFGNLQITGHMSDGSKIMINTSNESEGKRLIYDLATLTNNTVINFSYFGYLRKEGEIAIQYDDLYYKEPVRVYPAKLTIINKYRVLNLSSEQVVGAARKGKYGPYLKHEFSIPLWMDDEPVNFKALVAESLKIPGASPV